MKKISEENLRNLQHYQAVVEEMNDDYIESVAEMKRCEAERDKALVVFRREVKMILGKEGYTNINYSINPINGEVVENKVG